MKNIIFILCCFTQFTLSGQDEHFDLLRPLLGQWEGKGTGFGNDSSTVKANFTLIMDGKFIEFYNDSFFSPTPDNPEGSSHYDKGMISYDIGRKKVVLRQFHIEGYVNQYVLSNVQKDPFQLIFESETIENFTEEGKTKWILDFVDDETMKSSFFISFDGDTFSCTGINYLNKVDSKKD